MRRALTYGLRSLGALLIGAAVFLAWNDLTHWALAVGIELAGGFLLLTGTDDI